MATTSKDPVVIVGGGFGGLAAVQALAGQGLEILLIDRENHHLFQPLLYQVATAALPSTAIAAPLRHILRRHPDVRVMQGTVARVSPTEHALWLTDGRRLAFSQLILAAGATHSYFGKDGWAKDAPGLKTLADAMDIRRRVLTAYERAEASDDPQERQRDLTFVIVGAGPTGVEMAGAFAEIAHQTLTGEFRTIDPRDARVLLVDGADRPLLAYPADLAAKAGAALDHLGVERLHGARVVDVADGAITYEKDGARTTLRAGTIVWAAGVKASPLTEGPAVELGLALDRAGRIPVTPELSLPGAQDVYAIGDLAQAMSQGKPVPGIAPAAKQMGGRAAKNLLARLHGRTAEPFVYRDLGNLATIGRHEAVVSMGRFKLWGYPAWLFWVVAHIFFLIGWRNRFAAMSEWAWSYWTFGRGARVVSSPVVTGNDDRTTTVSGAPSS